MRRMISRMALGLAAAVVLLACAASSFMRVDYRLPGQPETLEGKKAHLTVKDRRPDETILGDSARKKFVYFNGNFSLFLIRGAGGETMLGTYPLTGLLTEAFRKRLQNLGMEVRPAPDAPELEVVVKEFFLDLSGQKWVINIAYEASLIRDGQTLARQIISADAERIRLLGAQSEVEKVLGEVFTDAVNQLNVRLLYEQAGI